MKMRIKIAVSIVVTTILTLGIIYNYDDIYIEIAKIYMVKTGKVSDHYVKFVMEKKGEMKIHEIAKYEEEKKKVSVIKIFYKKVANYYVAKKSKNEIIEIFCSRLDKTKYSSARQIGFREILSRKKEELIRLYLRKLGSDEARWIKTDALLRYVIATDEPEKNIDIVQDVAPLLTDRKQIFNIYWYLVNFHKNSNSPYRENILKILEKDLAGRLTQREINGVFGRK